MTQDAYADFAGRYDWFKGPFGEHDPEQVAFFQRLFDEAGVRRVLDCACGTGHELHLLHGLGYQVVGSDLSPAMLEEARANLATQGLDLPLVQADYRQLPAHFDEPFGAVICLSSAFLHMPDEAEALRALGSMRDVLRPGGLLVLSQGTTDRQWAEKPRFIPVVNTPETSRVFVIDYHEPGATYHVLDLLHTPDESDFTVWSERYEHVWLRDDYARFLEGAGLDLLGFYGDWGFATYQKETSRRLIVVATKPAGQGG